MDIQSKYTTESKLLADKDNIEVKKIRIPEESFALVEVLQELNSNLRRLITKL